MSATYASLVARTWRENVLFSVLVELTYRCNLDCYFCYNDLSLRGEPLSKEQYLRFFADLRELEVLNLTLSGGEPLAHPHFFELGAAARHLGFVVRVKSNGHALHGDLARRLRDEIDPFQVEVSLHGATASTHDRQTRVPGSFDRLLSNLREIRSLGLRVKLNATLTAWNEDEIAGMLDIARDLGCRIQFDPEVTPRDDGDQAPLSIAPSREGVLRLFRLLDERTRTAPGSDPDHDVEVGRQADALAPVHDAGKHCGAGSSTVAVDPFGNVYPCVQWRRPVGNLHREPIGEVWARSRGLRDVRALEEEIRRRVLELGPDAAALAFCPGLAEAKSGDPLAIYPGAHQRAEVVRQVRDERRPGALPVYP